MKPSRKRRFFLCLPLYMMEYLSIGDVACQNKEDQRVVVAEALDQFVVAQQVYRNVVLDVVGSGALSQQVDRAYQEIINNERSNPSNGYAETSGAYFANEDVIGGSRVEASLRDVNRSGDRVSANWTQMRGKSKLSPGIGYIESPALYSELLSLGMSSPDLRLNYTAPMGTLETCRGIKRTMDARIDPGRDFFSTEGVFVVEGATEGIDIALESIAVLKPGSRVVCLGFSYYTANFVAQNKGLRPDRLMRSPIDPGAKTQFLPTPQEIRTSLPQDTSTIVLTMPGNPDGGVYSDQELIEIMKLAREKGLIVLFDALFENMYFDRAMNFQSPVLRAAAKVGALDRVVIIDSLSKTMNLPGARLGMLATTNSEITRTLQSRIIARRCNPPLIYEPLYQFEGLARQMAARQRGDLSVTPTTLANEAFVNGVYPFTKAQCLRMYSEWRFWQEQALKYYEDNVRLVKTLLSNDIDAGSSDEAAFNTLVRLGQVPLGTNHIDFLAKLMFTTATYTQVGPCFGLSQRVWDTNLGVWSRITYACSRRDLIDGVARLTGFAQLYGDRAFGDINRFPVLQISYDNQI